MNTKDLYNEGKVGECIEDKLDKLHWFELLSWLVSQADGRSIQFPQTFDQFSKDEKLSNISLFACLDE